MPKVHRRCRHEWKSRPRDLTERDHQAMYNFAQENIPLETIAEHFHCSLAVVYEALARPWLRARKRSDDLGHARGLTWWESNHRDPLELVKLYYPQHVAWYFSHAAVDQCQAQEKRQTPSIDVEAYLEAAFGPGYLSADNLRIVENNLNDIIERLETYEVEYDSSLLVSLLDQRLIAKD